jgi:hypothetical protein
MPGEPANLHILQARKVAKERASGEAISIAELPRDASILRVLGVDYVHTSDEIVGDLYLTTVGYPFARHLQPDNWYESSWFQAKRERLRGSGSVYALPTKPVDGESLSLVVKFSRVGEKVPIDTELIEDLLCCEFNGPFEEFALVEELRHSRRGTPALQIRTQLPLAVYVPPERTQPSQSGRAQWRIARKVAQHPGVAIDILRQYIVVYMWIPGVDAWQARKMGLMTEDEARRLTDRATGEIRAAGFRVLDMKPEHLIVEPSESERVVHEGGEIRYGLVDFELLERTAEYYQELQSARKEAYEIRKRELTQPEDGPEASAGPLPANLAAVRILGVDYVHGRAESTGGMLWVVGGAPDLFDYFLPERWRTTPQIRLFENHETHFTTSKDNVRLVWKVSRVGEPPEVAAFGVDGFRVLAHGFNSPFEEVAAARWLSRRGIPTTLPRAIYRTGHRSQLDESLFDPSRYKTHYALRTIDGDSALDTRRNYITIWDYWNGPEEADAVTGKPVARSANAAQALERGLLDRQGAIDLVAEFKEALSRLGVEALRLLPEHILLCIDEEQALARDESGRLISCLCNFQYLSLPPAAKDEAS